MSGNLLGSGLLIGVGGAGGVAGVASFKGRTGTVSPEQGDYTEKLVLPDNVVTLIVDTTLSVADIKQSTFYVVGGSSDITVELPDVSLLPYAYDIRFHLDSTDNNLTLTAASQIAGNDTLTLSTEGDTVTLKATGNTYHVIQDTRPKPSGIGIFFYLLNEADVVLPAFNKVTVDQNDSDLSPTELDLTAVTVSTTDVLLKQFLTPLGLELGTLVATPFTAAVRARASATSKVQLYAKVFIRASGGTETLLSITDLGNFLTLSKANYTLRGNLPTHEATSTDRLIMKVYGTNSLGGNPTVTLSVEGPVTTRSSLNVPFPATSINHDILAGIQGDGYHHITAGEAASLALQSKVLTENAVVFVDSNGELSDDVDQFSWHPTNELLEISGAGTPAVNLFRDAGVKTSKMAMQALSASSGTIGQTTATGVPTLSIDASPSDGTSDNLIRVNRLTDTTGKTAFVICKGDGTFDQNHALYGQGGNSYIGAKSGGLVVGASTRTTGAKLEIAGTDGYLLLPRLTTTQRGAATATNGSVFYNTTTKTFEIYEDGAWKTMAAMEKGTWTPSLTVDGTVGDFAVTYTTQKGIYQRVGDIVELHFRVIGNVTHTTASGFIAVASLPFSPNVTNISLYIGLIQTSVALTWPTNAVELQAYLLSGGNIHLVTTAPGGSAARIRLENQSSPITLNLSGTISYEVT